MSDWPQPITDDEAREAWLRLQRQIVELRTAVQELERVANTWLAYLPDKHR